MRAGLTGLDDLERLRSEMGGAIQQIAERLTTALGAAYAAGLAVGFFKDTAELSANWAVDRRWEPKMEQDRREHLYRFWKKAVARSFDWAE